MEYKSMVIYIFLNVVFNEIDLLVSFYSLGMPFIYMLFWMSEFKQVTKEICKLPSFFSPALFKKIDSDGKGVVTRYAMFFFEKKAT